MEGKITQKITKLNETVLDSLDENKEASILAKFTDTAINILEADFGFAWLKKAGDKKFTLAYKHKLTPYEPVTPRKKGTNERVLTGRLPLYVLNVFKSKTVRADAKPHMRAFISIPVVYKNHTYGNIVVCFKKAQNFSPEIKSIAVSIGHSSAQAITINRLYNNVKQSNKELEKRVAYRTQELVETNRLLKQEISRRRKAQLALEATQHFTEQIANLVPGLIAVIDVATARYLYVNNAASRVLGYAAEEFMQQGVAFVNSLVHPEDAGRIAEENAAAMQAANDIGPAFDENIVNFEYRLRHKNGDWKWLHTYGIVFSRDDNGKVKEILNISVDITERKNIEQKLAENERILENAQAISHIGSWEWDLKTDKVSWSDELCRIYGTPVGFQGGFTDFLQLVHPQDRDAVNERIQTAFKNKKYFEFFHRIIQQGSGKERVMHARGEVITDSSGQVVKMLGTGQDVTQQQLAEAKLRASNKQLAEQKSLVEKDRAKDEALLSSIGEGILAADAKGSIILVNPVAEKILGKKSEDLLGKPFFTELPVYDENGRELQHENRPAYEALIKNKAVKATKDQHIFYRGKNNQPIPVSLVVTPVLFKGKIIGIVQVFRDITLEKEIDRVKSELISLASHQLRTPLSAINWYAEALLSGDLGKLNKDQKRYLNEIFHANQKMVELVYDFLNVSRIELGTFSIKLSTLDLREVVTSILKELTPLVNQKKLRLEEHYPKNLPLVTADRKIVRLILQNLITNSVKYTPSKGNIRVTVRLRKGTAKKSWLELEVADDGYGIPKHQQEKIFTKLFRADNAAKLDTEGSGLGLYLVKSFVEYCKGKIWFKSSEQKGTTFHVSLPVQITGNVDKVLDKKPSA